MLYKVQNIMICVHVFEKVDKHMDHSLISKKIRILFLEYCNFSFFLLTVINVLTLYN